MPTFSDILDKMPPADQILTHPITTMVFSIIVMYMLASINMDYIRELERRTQEQAECIERLKANSQDGPSQKDSMRKSARLAKKKEHYLAELQAILDAGKDERSIQKRADLTTQFLDYVYENIGAIELLICSTNPSFRAILIKKCKEYQKETKYPHAVEAATRILDWYKA